MFNFYSFRRAKRNKLADNKTKPTDVSVEDYIDAVPHEGKVADGKILLKLFEDITGHPPVMWGDRMVGFGTYHYEHRSCEGDWLMTGFAVNKTKLIVYLMEGFKGHVKNLEKLGKHKHSSSCLYINKLADIDLKVLEKMVKQSIKYFRDKYGCD